MLDPIKKKNVVKTKKRFYFRKKLKPMKTVQIFKVKKKMKKIFHEVKPHRCMLRHFLCRVTKQLPHFIVPEFYIII